MTNNELSLSYISKATKRLKILTVLKDESAFSDVVREAQEIVELVQKAILRKIGIDPPKWHDVGEIIKANFESIPKEYHNRILDLIPNAKWLRGERELSFYGDIDFIPTEEYTINDAEIAIQSANDWVTIGTILCKD
ncbi:MAG: HEPN domain-containing protein [Ignavibacteria bacterium]|nr:HEPN domain-containing protein [Ignavibacteria bacterium]